MKNTLLISAVLALGALSACGTPSPGTDGGTGGGSTTGGGGGTTGGGGGTTGGGGGMTLDLSTAAKINAYLEGKTMTMQGADIPSHPNGYNEDVNFGSASQCYAKVAISQLSGQFNVSSDLGTIVANADGGIVGACDHTRVATAAFTSTAVLIDNVQGNATCFDITATYNGFSQEGRGKITDDGKTVTLELFFGGQATGHRCADGAVGATGVQISVQGNTVPFTGNAQQVYRIP
jgi:hypothetical protein